MRADGEIVCVPEGGDMAGLTPIPGPLVSRVSFLNSKQRRAWRALVTEGADPTEALRVVQEGRDAVMAYAGVR